MSADPPPDDTRRPAPSQVRTVATDGEGRCFLCGRAFRPAEGEPISGGESVLLCAGCGVL